MRIIKRTFSREDMISRFPSAFAVMIPDDNGIMKVQSAANFSSGSWGHLVQNIVIGGQEYSYTQIINAYRSHLSEIDKNKIMSVEGLASIAESINANRNRCLAEICHYAIGLLPTTMGDDENFYTNCPLCPREVYRSSIPNLWKTYASISARCALYEELVERGVTIDECDDEYRQEVCCLKRKYELMGGDSMRKWLWDRKDQFRKVAEEFLDLCKDVKRGLSIETSLHLYSSTNDLGCYTPYVTPYNSKADYAPGDCYFKDDEQTGLRTTYTVELEDGNEVESVVDEAEEGEDNGLSPKMSSQLHGLRREVQYHNMAGETETPPIDEEWLFYYRKGMICNMEVATDIQGNILRVGTAGGNKNADDKEEYISDVPYQSSQEIAAAYGDIITDIKWYYAEGEEGVWSEKNPVEGVRKALEALGYGKDDLYGIIQINYIIGAQLKPDNKIKSEGGGNFSDELGNTLHFWGSLVVDTESNRGAKYTEYFAFDEDSEIDRLIQEKEGGGKFEKYIMGERDEWDSLGKYVMRPLDKRVAVTGFYDLDNTYTLTERQVECEFKSKSKDFIGVPIVRHDWLQGISYRPDEVDNVTLHRGYTSALEQHLRLGEMKTLEDLEDSTILSVLN